VQVSLESRELYQDRSGVRPRASSFRLLSGPQYAIQQLQKVASGERLTRKSLGKHFMESWVVQTASAAKRALWKVWLCLALAVDFLAWQGCAGSIEALSLVTCVKSGGGPLVVYRR
jgi:hypothetical protein